MKSVLTDFVSLIYPRTCFYCSESLTSSEDHLCLNCELDLPKYEQQTKKNHLKDKFAYLPKVAAADAFLTYLKSGIVQKLIHGVKYQGKKSMGTWLGSFFGSELRKTDLTGDLLIPLPIHDKRLAQRGYNQSEVMAIGLSEQLQIPIESDTVSRSKLRITQTKKSKTDRWINQESSFVVTYPERIEGKEILLFDDVITTGATMGNFCEEISKYNPASIRILALAAGK